MNICTAQLQKMLRLRGKAVDEEQKDSGEEQRDEDEGLGPRSNISLLDQHQHLKEKAEGVLFKHYPHWLWLLPVSFFSHFNLNNILLSYCLINHNHNGSVVSHLLYVFVSTARKESAKEKQLKEEEKILESVAEGRGKNIML